MPALAVTLQAEFEYCAMTYCGASKTSDDTFTECLNFILTQYANLGIGEIKAAFSYAAKEGPEDLKAYYGTFSVALLGVVLKRYVEHRNSVIKQLQIAENEAARERMRGAKDNYWKSDAGKAELLRIEMERLQKLAASETLKIEDVTVRDYELLETHSGLKLTKEEKWDLMKAAEAFIDEKERLNEEQRKDKLKVIAQKIAVVEFFGHTAEVKEKTLFTI